MKQVLERLKGGENNDYVLRGNSAWIDVENLTVYLVKTDEGISIDVFPKRNGETEIDDPIVSTWALFNEAN